MSNKIIKAIAVTAELTSTELSEHALIAMDDDLAAYNEDEVLRALNRCRRELTGRLTLAAIIERIQESDGRPGADEAWALACSADDESETVLWTSEAEDAFFRAARPLLESGDKIAARMAFREIYTKSVKEARERRDPVSWKASLGWDNDKRRTVLTKAEELGRLPAAYVRGLLPPPTDGASLDDTLRNGQLRLDGKVGKELPADAVAERIRHLKQLLKP